MHLREVRTSALAAFIDIAAVVPKDGGTFATMGSLPRRPCSKALTWLFPDRSNPRSLNPEIAGFVSE